MAADLLAIAWRAHRPLAPTAFAAATPDYAPVERP
jgi:hypothetical protein